MKKKILVSMDFELYSQFKEFQSNIQKELGGRITYAIVIQSLLNESKKLKKLRVKFKKLNKEYKNNLQNLLKNSISRPVMLSATKNFDLMDPPRPPGPPKKIKSEYSLDEKIRIEFAAEIKKTFTGEILRPSEILARRNLKISAA